MTTKYSRRAVITNAALALIGTAIAGRTKAQTAKPSPTPAVDPPNGAE